MFFVLIDILLNIDREDAGTIPFEFHSSSSFKVMKFNPSGERIYVVHQVLLKENRVFMKLLLEFARLFLQL